MLTVDDMFLDFEGCRHGGFCTLVVMSGKFGSKVWIVEPDQEYWLQLLMLPM